MQLLEEDKDLIGGAGVEVTGGLVGEDDGGVVDQGTGNGHALHLSARHLVALVLQAVAESHGLQGGNGSLATLSAVVFLVVHEGQLHVLHGGGLRQEVVVLEYEANLAVTQTGTLTAAHGAHADAIEVVLAAGGGVEASELVQQGGLAGARGAHDGDELTFINLEGDASQSLHRLVAHLEVAADVIELDDYFLFHYLLVAPWPVRWFLLLLGRPGMNGFLF